MAYLEAHMIQHATLGMLSVRNDNLNDGRAFCFRLDGGRVQQPFANFPLMIVSNREVVDVAYLTFAIRQPAERISDDEAVDLAAYPVHEHDRLPLTHQPTKVT